MTALICVWKPRISSYYHTCRGRKCHWAVGRSVAWRHFKGTCDRAGLLAFFFRIYANQKPRKDSIGYGHSSGKPGCGARVQEHRHAPEIGPKSGVRGQDRSLLRSRSGRSHAILPAPTNLFQSDIHSLNSFSIVLRFVNSYQWAARFIVCYCIRCTNHRKTLTGQSHDVLLWKGMGDTPKKTSESNSKCFICSSIPTSKKQGLCIWKNFHRFSRSHLIFGRIWREKYDKAPICLFADSVSTVNQVR